MMIGRKVVGNHRYFGEVIKWEPLGASVCDTLVRRPDGTMFWCSSLDLRPTDGHGPLPTRLEATQAAMKEARDSLLKIRSDLIREIEEHRRWAGCEFGKGHLLQSINGALEDLDKK